MQAEASSGKATVHSVWTKSKVQALIESNDKAAIRALLVVYANQTESEKSSHAAAEHNGIGFSQMDAEILTSFAQFYGRAGFLSAKQMTILRKKIVRYWKQVLTAIERNGLPVVYTRTK